MVMLPWTTPSGTVDTEMKGIETLPSGTSQSGQEKCIRLCIHLVGSDESDRARRQGYRASLKKAREGFVVYEDSVRVRTAGELADTAEAH